MRVDGGGRTEGERGKGREEFGVGAGNRRKNEKNKSDLYSFALLAGLWVCGS